MSEPILRDLNPDAPDEIERVAQGMRATLIEVEGETHGGTMYSMDWLRERVRWHLDPAQTQARVVLGLDAQGTILGHTIFRVEGRPDAPFGLISTTYVWPESRRLGLANRFLQMAQDWFHDQGLAMCCTWTSSTNQPLIALYTRHGFTQTEQGPNDLTGTLMIRLSKTLAPAPAQ